MKRPGPKSIFHLTTMKIPSLTFVAVLLLTSPPLALHAASTLRLAYSVVSVAESAGHTEVAVLRVNDLDTAVTVNYATSALAAIAGTDYTETSGSLTFDAGEAGHPIWQGEVVGAASPRRGSAGGADEWAERGSA